MGAAVTAALFAVGKVLIGLYLGRSSVASTFGAAGSLVLFMVWVYYSAQVFLLGAEFTRVYAARIRACERRAHPHHARRQPDPAEPLLPLIRAKQSGQPYDEQVYRERLALSVKEVVQRQADAGIDVPSDGEFGKSISWSQYALERLSGFERRPVRGLGTIAQGADRKRFAAFYAELDAASGPPATALTVVGEAVCVGPIRYTGHAEVQRDIANFKAALEAAGVEKASCRWRRRRRDSRSQE